MQGQWLTTNADTEDPNCPRYTKIISCKAKESFESIHPPPFRPSLVALQDGLLCNYLALYWLQFFVSTCRVIHSLRREPSSKYPVLFAPPVHYCESWPLDMLPCLVDSGIAVEERSSVTVIVSIVMDAGSSSEGQCRPAIVTIC